MASIVASASRTPEPATLAQAIAGKFVMAANNGDFLRDAAVAGHGLTVLPTFLVWQQNAKGDLVPVMTDYTVVGLNAYAIYPQTRHLSHRVRALIDFLIDWFGGAPYWDENI